VAAEKVGDAVAGRVMGMDVLLVDVESKGRGVLGVELELGAAVLTME
jgi:hypothetical protein